MTRVPTVLSIAGSDSGGGAGIQADLKAFARCGVHGMTAITGLTVQNTVEVRDVLPTPPEVIVAQVRIVAEDLGVDAVKVGMLGSETTIAAVAEALSELPAGTPIVVDPVMVAESGGRLLERAAEDAVRERILPLATVVTPNLGEARVLAEASDDTPLHDVARRLRELGARNVIVTGGHRDEASDLLLTETGEFVEIPGERHPDGAAHGSGCTHSSTLAAHLALGYDLVDGARAARAIAGEAVRDGLRDLGRGAGPVDVFGLARRTRGAAPDAGADVAGARADAGADVAGARADAGSAADAGPGADARAATVTSRTPEAPGAPSLPSASLPLS